MLLKTMWLLALPLNNNLFQKQLKTNYTLKTMPLATLKSEEVGTSK